MGRREWYKTIKLGNVNPLFHKQDQPRAALNIDPILYSPSATSDPRKCAHCMDIDTKPPVIKLHIKDPF